LKTDFSRLGLNYYCILERIIRTAMPTPLIKIKKAIINNLRMQGFKVDKKNLISSSHDFCKEEIRSLHKHSYTQKILMERDFILKNYGRLSNYFADGTSVNLKKFKPVVHLIEPATEMSDLFRFATLLWSVPVSHGFGRRLRFVVLDESKGKLIGIFAMGDPVFNLKVRDNLIGWNHEMRADRLYNVMDLFVIGAVPPYSQLLCGKLMAMLATSNEVRKIVWDRYKKAVTNIRGESKKPHLTLLTTSSALGRSSLYNRITLDEKPLFIRIGETIGWGHFHLSNGSFALMREYLSTINHPINKLNRFGQGPNWKIRTIRTCLELLDLPSDLLQHGIRREVYAAPLAHNYREYLLGQSKRPLYLDLSEEKLVNFFIQRWLLPRAARKDDYKNVKAIHTLKDIKTISDT
jgi:Domain of unknown function (DUF4338)